MSFPNLQDYLLSFAYESEIICHGRLGDRKVRKIRFPFLKNGLEKFCTERVMKIRVQRFCKVS